MLEAKEASITSLQALLAGQRRAAEETAELYEDQRVALKASVTQMGRWGPCVDDETRMGEVWQGPKGHTTGSVHDTSCHVFHHTSPNIQVNTSLANSASLCFTLVSSFTSLWPGGLLFDNHGCVAASSIMKHDMFWTLT